MKFKEGDLVLCKVVNIEGTSVFLEVEGAVKGTMMLSEVVAGRIRNLREYVSPKKMVVCKVLKVFSDHLELSLRRVTAKEREQVLDIYKKERSFRNLLKATGEDPDKVFLEIKREYSLAEFFDSFKDNPQILNKFVKKESAQKIFNLFREKDKKERKVFGRFILKSFSETGISDIKEILSFENMGINYLGNSVFSVTIVEGDFKTANASLQNFFDEVSRRAKQRHALFEIKKEK